MNTTENWAISVIINNKYLLILFPGLVSQFYCDFLQ